MYRVLHVMPSADIGGISAVVLNYYRFMDRGKIHFDVVLTTEGEGQDAQSFKDLGAKIFHIPAKSKGYAQYETLLTKLLTEGMYDCIHVHENTTSYVALKIAKKAGIRHRIAHSHTSSPAFSLKWELKRLSGCLLNYRYATAVIGCGKLAGERVFGKWNMRKKNAVVLPNSIDSTQYAFDAQVRDRMRKELGISGKHVIGMVGRLSPEKNHAYALQLMKKLCALREDAVLVVVGNGDSENQIREIIDGENLEDHVLMLGKRGDMSALYQSFDLLIMPSLHEGFPVAAVEAMAAGLPVLLSDTITKELQFGSARYLKLGDDGAWIEAMLRTNSDETRANGAHLVQAHNLDIRRTATILEHLYLVGRNKE